VPRTRLGLVLSMADGRRFGIAMDQAEVAAGIVNAMLDRRRLSGPSESGRDRCTGDVVGMVRPPRPDEEPT
jgi:hypothetical protein